MPKEKDKGPGFVIKRTGEDRRIAREGIGSVFRRASCFLEQEVVGFFFKQEYEKEQTWVCFFFLNVFFSWSAFK